MARALIDRGFTNVRPLAGGFDAWVAAGYPIEETRELPAQSASVT